jgi:hypothetical protein
MFILDNEQPTESLTLAQLVCKWWVSLSARFRRHSPSEPVAGSPPGDDTNEQGRPEGLIL